MNEDNKKAKILIADDEEKNIKLMAGILKNYGYSYETAKNGYEAIEKTNAYLPDLILLDIMMPYKPPFDHEKTFKIITEGDGRTMPEHFDPQILQIFKGLHKQFEEIFEAHKD